MKQKNIIITIAFCVALGAYYGIKTITKNTYYERIEKKMDGICSDRFFEAISVSYPFLWQSASVIRLRAGAIKSIVSQAGYDRYTFSVMWNNYENSQDGRRDFHVLHDFETFTISNAYSSLIHTRNTWEKESYTVYKLAKAAKLIKKPQGIADIDSIQHAADIADGYALDFFFDLSHLRDESHGINDWRNFNTIDYSKRFQLLKNLKEKPFSLYDYWFNNPIEELDN